MKYHIGIFGTQMNVCTLIEKNIIDFFSCKKIKPDIDIWNLFEVAKNNLILNNKKEHHGQIKVQKNACLEWMFFFVYNQKNKRTKVL